SYTSVNTYKCIIQTCISTIYCVYGGNNYINNYCNSNLAHNVLNDSSDNQSGAPASCDNESNSAKPSTCRSRIYIPPGLVLWCTLTINQQSCLLRGGHFMAKIHDSILHTIGGTPLVRLNSLTKDIRSEERRVWN